MTSLSSEANTNTPILPSSLQKSNKKIYQDCYFSKDNNINIINMLNFELNEQEKYRNSVYIRVNATKRLKLLNFDFSHSFFEDCMLRSITFENCIFIDCKFKNCDFKGTTFINCNFQYANFQSTFLDDEILYTSAPREANLRRNFARNLKINFYELGLKKQEDVATRIELEATATWLKKAWSSTDEYYTKKYGGIIRVYKFGAWCIFKLNDFIWGHGKVLGNVVFQ